MAKAENEWRILPGTESILSFSCIRRVLIRVLVASEQEIELGAKSKSVICQEKSTAFRNLTVPIRAGQPCRLPWAPRSHEESAESS